MDNFNHTESQPHYNTTDLSESEWAAANEKAKKLQDVIQKIYESNPTRLISPWQMYEMLSKHKKVNKNSVGRSISNLKNDLVLLKTTLRRIGKEGATEFFYVLNSPENASKEALYKKGQKSAGDIASKMLSNGIP